MARVNSRAGNIGAAVVIFVIILATLTVLRPQTVHIATFNGSGVVSNEQSKSQLALEETGHEERPTLPATEKGVLTLPTPIKPPDIDEPLQQTQGAEATPTPETQDHVPHELTRIVVMGKLSDEETDWVSEELTDWQNAVYVVDLPSNVTSPTGHRTKVNKSKEALPYLTYIIDNYPNFPDVVAFIHSHRKGYPEAWHNDAIDHDAVLMLRELQLNFVRERGYVNLRCVESPGCPDEIQPWREPRDESKATEHLFPYVYADFFDQPISAVREQVPVVATPCCAQFAVSREQILRRSKKDYEHYRSHIEASTYDDDTIGRVMEYMWHIIFGQEAVHCPDNVGTCWCEVYGRCEPGWMLRGNRGSKGAHGG